MLLKSLIEYFGLRELLNSENKPSALILDPQLRDGLGHHLNVSQALGETAVSLGLKPLIYGSNRPNFEQDPKFEIIPHFELHTYGIPNRAFRRDENPSTVEEQQQFASELENLPDNVLRSARLILLPTVLGFQLSGLSSWILNGGNCSQAPIFVWILFDSTFAAASPEQERWANREYVAAFNKLELASETTGQKIILVCETRNMADQVSTMTKLETRQMRLANLASKENLETGYQPSEDGALTVLFAGHANREKGAHHLPAIIETILSRNRKVRFKVHLLLEATNVKHGSLQSRLLEFGEAVEIITGSLNTKNFHELVASADIMLMPYDPKAYRNRGSGVFHEAMTFGVPMVLPTDASFSVEALDKGTAIGFDEYTAASIADALHSAISSHDRLKKNAIKVASGLGSHQQSLAKLFYDAMQDLP